MHKNSCLGIGGFGIVKLAGDVKRNNVVAIKSINKSSLSENDLADATTLFGEIDILAKAGSLKSNFLMGLYDFFEESNCINIVSEYCNEGDLYERLQERHLKKDYFTVKEVLSIMYQINCGLYDLHSIKIAHRDLKPQNVFIRNNRLILGDFGLSKIIDPRKQWTERACGTPGFMAPEIFTKDYDRSEKVDMFALGCIGHML